MLKRKVTFLGLFIALPLFASAIASPSVVGAAEKPANVAGVSLRFVSLTAEDEKRTNSTEVYFLV